MSHLQQIIIVGILKCGTISQLQQIILVGILKCGTISQLQQIILVGILKCGTISHLQQIILVGILKCGTISNLQQIILVGILKCGTISYLQQIILVGILKHDKRRPGGSKKIVRFQIQEKPVKADAGPTKLQILCKRKMLNEQQRRRGQRGHWLSLPQLYVCLNANSSKDLQNASCQKNPTAYQNTSRCDVKNSPAQTDLSPTGITFYSCTCILSMQ